MENTFYGKSRISDLTPQELCLLSVDIQLICLFRNEASFAIGEISDLFQGRSTIIKDLESNLYDYSFETFCKLNGLDDCCREFESIKPILRMEKQTRDFIKQHSKTIGDPQLN